MLDRITDFQELWAPREMSNRELWHWRVGHTPDRRWLWYEEGREWTYAQFDVEMRRLASGLRSIGVGAGTRVLLGMNNTPEAVLCHLALTDVGAVCIPLLPGMPFEELIFPVTHSEGSVLIADDPIASVVAQRRDEVPGIEQYVVLGETEGDIAGAVRFEELAAADPLEYEPLPSDDIEALSYVIYTSGSTGRPKGVMTKSASRYWVGLGYADLYAFTSEDTYIHPLTLAHSLGAMAALGVPMVTGGAVALTERFRPTRFWGAVADSGATISVLFQAHLSLLLETDDGSVAKGSSSLRFVVTHADLPSFRDRFGVQLGTIWGMSETLACVGSDPGYAGELGPGFVGRPFVGGEVGIFDEDFNQVAPYEYGELCMRHPQAMLGYLKDPEATERALVDGWVRSGDRGYRDHTGRFYFAGRYKAMIKRSGENVSAEEVEAALEKHPDVAECAVVAVPDRIRTEEVGAVVVRRAGTKADPGELREVAGEKLVRWKLPRYVLVLDEPLPRLGNGKIDRVGTAALIDPEQTWDAEAQSARAVT